VLKQMEEMAGEVMVRREERAVELEQELSG